MKLSNRSPWAVADTLDDLVSLAWTTFIGSELVRIDRNELGLDVVCASIAISGPSSATVLFFADPVLARLGASKVLGVAATDLTDVDIHDVMGEIVNIVGGNLKGVVSDGVERWSLSLPVVSNAMQTSPGSQLVSEVYFLTVGGTVGCQILQHT